MQVELRLGRVQESAQVAGELRNERVRRLHVLLTLRLRHELHVAVVARYTGRDLCQLHLHLKETSWSLLRMSREIKSRRETE